MDDYEQFRQLHLTQLRRVPEHLWTALHYKLQAEVSQLGHVMLCVSVRTASRGSLQNRPTLLYSRTGVRRGGLLHDEPQQGPLAGAGHTQRATSSQ